MNPAGALILPENSKQELVRLYRYDVVKMQSPYASLCSYGILGIQKLQESWTAVVVAAPFSDDYEAVSLLAEKCTALQLSPEHLIDVVSDFFSQTTLST